MRNSRIGLDRPEKRENSAGGYVPLERDVTIGVLARAKALGVSLSVAETALIVRDAMQGEGYAGHRIMTAFSGWLESKT